MIQILGALITVATISGLGVIMDGATGLSVWVRARLRAWASPHAKDEPKEDTTNAVEDKTTDSP